MLGLPAHVRACLFGLDGVFTRTAKVHAAARKEMSDGYLRDRATREETAGVRAFLAARGAHLPETSPQDPPDAETVNGPGNVHAARAAGLRHAVVSSSANNRDVLRAAGIEDLFDERIDGVAAHERRLRGKPAPDTYLEAARGLGPDPGEAAVFEDAHLADLLEER